MIWIAWRQQRVAIVSTAALAIALVALMVAHHRGVFYGDQWYVRFPLDLLVPHVPSTLGFAVAVFWAAPLISREYENRTHLVAWGQDATARQWLTTKVVLLATVAVALTVAVAAVANRVFGMYGNVYYSTVAFETHPFLQATYTLFGFSLGLVSGALLRRTLPAMGATAVAFLAVRGVMSLGLREHLLPPARTFRPFTVAYTRPAPDGSWMLADGYADATGQPMEINAADITGCGQIADQAACLKSKGVGGYYTEYLPAEQLPWLRLIEAGIYAVLAAVLLAVAFRWAAKVSAHRSRPAKTAV
ncbi:hypothetical protein [Kibdelosporangium phytohabitans]|uniref:Transporter n=1 Tax=Kibdelosporangium phytohabitans TaxID=860235 RepID=A0A0N9I1C6_9PSEU|nr:hypothetical protein [Kibdelosporangium phytohabitans]ALG08488.1 hypothetical protein AOZ06_17595 [Kibdelosporangium phytohabitans]MBE1470448.1 drug/metabolite transporter superfamily protein YnfA [Kibdelosporangium phytohabitans]